MSAIKKVQRYICCICCLSLLFACLSFPVYAEKILHDYATRTEKFSNAITRLITLSDFQPVVQFNGSVCMAAVAEQTLEYMAYSSGISNFDLNQQTVAGSNGLGIWVNNQYVSANANSGNLMNYIEGFIETYGFTCAPYERIPKAELDSGEFTATDLANWVYTDVLFYDVPLIASVIEVAGTDNWTWPYATGSHFVNIIGIATVSGEDRLCIADPFYQRMYPSAPIEDSIYWIKMDTFFNVGPNGKFLSLLY